MNNNNDSGILIFVGGVIAVCAIFAVVIKALQHVFAEIGRLLEAFAFMATGFIHAVWAVTQIVGLIAIAVFVVAASVYFTYKYVKMVKRGTEIVEEVQLRMNSLYYQVQRDNKILKDDLERQVEFLEARLDKALKAPEAAPPAQVPLLEPPTNKDDCAAAADNDQSAQETTGNNENTIAPKQIASSVLNSY